MKFELTDYFLKMTPENAQDRAWIELVFGLKTGKESGATIKRFGPLGVDPFGFVQVFKKDE